MSYACSYLFVYILLVGYSVQPHPIYYADEPADVTYFEGSTIEFSCDVFCEHNCESLIFYNRSFLLLDGNIFGAPFDYKLYRYDSSAKLTLKVTNAGASSTGSYQCLTKAWRDTYIANKEINFHMTGSYVYTCIDAHMIRLNVNPGKLNCRYIVDIM